MSISGYLKDRFMAYIIFVICYVFTVIFLRAFHIGWQPVFVVTVIDIAGCIIHEIWNLSRKKGFYDRINTVVDELDKKYFLSEMLDKPSFYEGKIIYDALCSCDKSMTENVNIYRKQASEFREYIEMWVHEVKIPVSGLRLINHNTGGPNSEKINMQIRRIDECIDNVLYYARSENAEKDYIIKEESLKKVFSDVAIRSREAIHMIDGSIETDGLDKTVVTDGKWLEFILGQLVSNSIKYSSLERPLVLSVTAEKSDIGTVLSFRDNGIGITQSNLPYIFEKSFTGNNGRKNSKSTGMGLYIVRNLCERLGHSISVSSKENEYTEFKIVFANNDFYKIK